MGDELSNFPTISIRFKIPGVPCKYNTENNELLICGPNVRCPKGFFDIGSGMCQPISDVRVNGIRTPASSEYSPGGTLPDISMSHLFIAMTTVVILLAFIITACRYILFMSFSGKSKE
ncbi:MAG: hypothetical protein AAGF07_04540 [Patescibacteria group bacterium]